MDKASSNAAVNPFFSGDVSNSLSHFLIYVLSRSGVFKRIDLTSSISLGLPAKILWMIKSSADANMTFVPFNKTALASILPASSHTSNMIQHSRYSDVHLDFLKWVFQGQNAQSHAFQPHSFENPQGRPIIQVFLHKLFTFELLQQPRILNHNGYILVPFYNNPGGSPLSAPAITSCIFSRT